ncbi:hypothetical protein BC830DRAFT_1158960 [Chytriomyces sp. MP71]|nr:hypothetical protein BC830DRAFT_1158960 [Chytriomyces sp. MP71]
MTHQEPTPTPSPPPPRLPLRQHETEATERSVYVDKALLEYRKGARVFFPDGDEGWTLAESTIDAELKGLIFSAMFTIIKNGEVRVLQKHVKDLVEADLPLLRKPGDEVSDSTTLLNSVNPGAPMNNATFTESHIAKARKSISLTKNASPVLWNFSSMEVSSLTKPFQLMPLLKAE